jgi:hypothetical protein
MLPQSLLCSLLGLKRKYIIESWKHIAIRIWNRDIHLRNHTLLVQKKKKKGFIELCLFWWPRHMVLWHPNFLKARLCARELRSWWKIELILGTCESSFTNGWSPSRRARTFFFYLFLHAQCCIHGIIKKKTQHAKK